MAEVEDQRSTDLLALLAQVRAYAAANGLSPTEVATRLLSLLTNNAPPEAASLNNQTDRVSDEESLAALLERDRKYLEDLLARKELDHADGSLLLSLLQAEYAAATGVNELRCAVGALNAVLVRLDKSLPVARALEAMGLNPLRLLTRLHNAVQNYDAGAVAMLNTMRGEDDRTNAAPSAARERAAIAWCVHRLSVGKTTKNGAFSVTDAARKVSKYLKRAGLPRTYLAVRSIYYAVTRDKDAAAAVWFRIIEADPSTNPPGMERQSKVERLAWLNNDVTFF